MEAVFPIPLWVSLAALLLRLGHEEACLQMRGTRECSSFLGLFLCQGTWPTFLGIHSVKLHTREMKSDGMLVMASTCLAAAAASSEGEKRPRLGRMAPYRLPTHACGDVELFGDPWWRSGMFQCKNRSRDGEEQMEV